MATHFSILAWRIPWTEEIGGIWSTGLQRVGHDRACIGYKINMCKSIIFKLLRKSFKMLLFLFFLHLIKYSNPKERQ